MTEPRDRWYVLDMLLKALAGIGIPAALFIVGHQFAVEQQRATTLSSLLGPLASENPRARTLRANIW